MWNAGGGLSYYCENPNPSSSYYQKVVVACESRIPVMNDVDNLLIITKRTHLISLTYKYILYLNRYMNINFIQYLSFNLIMRNLFQKGIKKNQVVQ